MPLLTSRTGAEEASWFDRLPTVP